MAQTTGSEPASDVEWTIGDQLLAATAIEDRPGAAKANAARSTLRDSITLTWIGRVCEAFPPERRRVPLPFSHYLAVLPLENGQRDVMLDRGAKEGWTAKQIRRAVLNARVADGSYVPPFEDDAEDKAYRGIVQAWNRASRSAREMFIDSTDEADFADIIL